MNFCVIWVSIYYGVELFLILQRFDIIAVE